MKKILILLLLSSLFTSCFTKYAKRLDDRAIEKITERQKQLENQKQQK